MLKWLNTIMTLFTSLEESSISVSTFLSCVSRCSCGSANSYNPVSVVKLSFRNISRGPAVVINDRSARGTQHTRIEISLRAYDASWQCSDVLGVHCYSRSGVKYSRLCIRSRKEAIDIRQSQKGQYSTSTLPYRSLCQVRRAEEGRDHFIWLRLHTRFGGGSGKTLTLDQVYNILMTLKQTGSWVDAFKYIP